MIESIEERILRVLDEIRPYLLIDNGNVEFVRFDAEHGIVEVRFTGACKTCSMLPMTMRAGIERALRAAIVEVKRIESVK